MTIAELSVREYLEMNSIWVATSIRKNINAEPFQKKEKVQIIDQQIGNLKSLKNWK
jgi:hypothetical protein